MTQATIFKSNQSQAVRLWNDWFNEPPLTDFPCREPVYQAERKSF